jgi:hypothetical protein
MVRLFNVSAWSPHPELTDGVVHLTSFRDGDAPTMVEWNHEADIARWFDFPPLPPNVSTWTTFVESSPIGTRTTSRVRGSPGR